jgi:TolA-binding protein
MRLRVVLSMYLALFSVAAVMIGCTTKGLDYEAGLRKFEAGELDDAIKILEGIVQEGGSYTNRARYYIGECYKLQFKWDEAIQQFQMIADSEPPTSYLASEARNRISQISEGRRDIERIRIIHDNNPGTDQAADALMELGSVYENKLEDYDNSIKAYQQLIEEFPGTSRAAQAQVNIGYVYFYKLYDYTGGWPEFRKVNEQNYPELKFRVSEVEDLLRDTNKVLGEIKEHQAFIKMSQKRKIPRGGRKVLGYDIYGERRDQVAQSLLAVAKKWRRLKNYPKAIEACRMLIDRLPLMLRQAAQARYTIAEIYQLDQRRYLEAVDAYQDYIKSHPTDFRRHEAIYNMAICYESLRDYSEAYENYKTYRDTYPEGQFFKAAELKVRQWEYDEDQDGFPYYKELIAGTSDTDANQHP